MRCVRERSDRRLRARSVWLSFAPALVTAAVLMVYAGTMLPSLAMRSFSGGVAYVPRVAESATPPDDATTVAKDVEFAGDALTTVRTTPRLYVELGGSAVARSVLAGLLGPVCPKVSAMLMPGTGGEEFFVTLDAVSYRQLRMIVRVYGLDVATGAGLRLFHGYASPANSSMAGGVGEAAGLIICVVP